VIVCFSFIINNKSQIFSDCDGWCVCTFHVSIGTKLLNIQRCCLTCSNAVPHSTQTWNLFMHNKMLCGLNVCFERNIKQTGKRNWKKLTEKEGKAKWRKLLAYLYHVRLVCECWIVGKVYTSFFGGLFVGYRIFQPVKHSFTCKKISVGSLSRKECVGVCNSQQYKVTICLYELSLKEATSWTPEP